MANLYGIKPARRVFADSVVITYINLDKYFGLKGPGDFVAAENKLFLGDGSIKSFMNIDKKERTISFPEKDNANREGAVNELSKIKTQVGR